MRSIAICVVSVLGYALWSCGEGREPVDAAQVDTPKDDTGEVSSPIRRCAGLPVQERRPSGRRCCLQYARSLGPPGRLQKWPAQLTQTVKFETLPGLEDEGEQLYTIVARGELVDGTPVAFGCDDENGHVSSTSSRHVSIQLEDIPLP